MTQIQTKDQQIQEAIAKEIAVALALQMIDLVLGIIPGWVWPGWNPARRIDETHEADFDTLSLAQIKAWSSATADEAEGDLG